MSPGMHPGGSQNLTEIWLQLWGVPGHGKLQLGVSFCPLIYFQFGEMLKQVPVQNLGWLFRNLLGTLKKTQKI